MEKLKAYVGIDPGVSGAMALLTKDGRYYLQDWVSEVQAIQTLRNWKNFFDLKAQLELIVSGTSKSLYPNNKLATNYGFYRGALFALNIEFMTAAPRSWQSRVFIPSQKKDTKKRAFETVHFLFQGLREHIKYTSKHSGRADAILIAYDLKKRDKTTRMINRLQSPN